jgi:hypothetical protein
MVPMYHPYLSTDSKRIPTSRYSYLREKTRWTGFLLDTFLHVKLCHALQPMHLSLVIGGVPAELFMATKESYVFPPEEQTTKTVKVKSDFKPPESGKRNGATGNDATGYGE